MDMTHNEMPKDTVEELVVNAQCDAGDVVTGWVVQSDEVRRLLTTAHNKGVEVGREQMKKAVENPHNATR